MTLQDQLRDSLDSLESPLDLNRLASAARRQGTRRKHWRTAGLGAAAVLTVAGLVAGASTLPGRGGQESTVAADAPAVADPPAPSGADVAATPRGIAAALDWAVAQEESGTASDFAGQGSTSVVGDFYSELRWTDADGAGLSVIGINVQFAADDGRPSCGDVAQLDCRLVSLSDGTQLASFSERDEVAGGVGIRRTVDIFRPDGVRVVVSATNGLDLGGDAEGRSQWKLTRPTPPLTIAQLTDIARRPFWNHTLPQSFEDAGATLAPYVDFDARSARQWIYGDDPAVTSSP